MEDITIQDLITEQKNRIPLLYLEYNHSGILSYYKYPDIDSYYKWLEKAKRFIEINYPDDKHIADFEQISNQDIWPDQLKQLLAILEAFAALPTAIPRTKPSTKKQDQERGPIHVTTNINNSNSQTQNQQQTLAVEFSLELLKTSYWTSNQRIEAVVAEAGNDLQKARPGIIEKLKSFGADVTSNIVANLLTNPAI